MNKQTRFLICTLAIFILTLGLTSAMTVNSINADNFQPGSDQNIIIKVKNTLTNDAKDVSLILNLPTGTPFTIISSDNSIDEISSDDSESFSFEMKASNDAKAGDYSIPYTLSYSINGTQQTPRTGTFSLTVEANPELSYSVSTDNPIIGAQGKIKLTIVNKGLGDAKFVNVKITSEGYTLLSDENDYIGTISSDDSQTVNFDVIFNNQNPTLNVLVEYKDFDNNKVTKNVNLPITVYSNKEALKLGIIKQDNTFLYILIVAIGIGVWIIVGKIKKKKRLNKAQGR
ncbi:NPCBM-associated, NEW3 domain of alpha-galactosidase [uncultured archaeon]|nr:NPCBM-associated, NEW3 domain of alpha-galactosidase [uncultured archaeon]